ncbi:Bidirectional sugar transporter SWEET [Quillaja saponaria]|uniref:Bidirectional sugar transporter SWEET n=1 Tax=Quillaja saponaria TaxID=32244 RepID=A0AAD7PLB0_QUISA|nr:Bidirectional sugar transporter SWEET [Quillaja saponaria]
MTNWLFLMVGVMGNAASLLLYAAPILTFPRVIGKKSTEEFSCVPYIVALLSCLLYTWYGLPIVSSRWENLLLVTTTGIGTLFELSFILIYVWFASAKAKVKVAMGVIPVILLFCTTAVVSVFAFHDHHHRKIFVGSIALVASAAMYGSPLVSVKKVMTTRSVEYMPFYLSISSFLSSSLWMVYGLLKHDLFIASPSIVGFPLTILQLVLYFKYRKMGTTEERKCDLENNDEKFKQLQLVMSENINGKS